MLKTLELELFFRMIVISTQMIEAYENMCLDIGFNLHTDRVENEDDVEATPKELLGLIDILERRTQLNIESPLEVSFKKRLSLRLCLSALY